MAYYFMMGLLWLIHAEYSYNKMGEPLTNAGRLRYFLFWPITLLAFIWGLIEHILNNNNDDEL